MTYRNMNVGLLAYGETGICALRALNRKFKVQWVVVPPGIKPDTPVLKYAKEKSLVVYKTNQEEKILRFVTKYKTDYVIISSYNRIISPKTLARAKFINVHHGDLPRWRGRANINWAIILGKKFIGLTIHDASKELDAGSIYAQYKIRIGKKDDIKTVYERLNNVIEKNLANIVIKVSNGYRGRPQQGLSTYCCTRVPNDGHLDWSQKSKDILNLIRALTHPYPGAFTFYKNKKLLIWNAEIPKPMKKYVGRIPGRVVEIHEGNGVEVLTGDSSIIIKNITYDDKFSNASEVIKTLSGTLGIDFVALVENMKSK